MTELLFYNKPVGLNKKNHQNLKICQDDRDYSFARFTNSVILAGAEFASAAKEYPICFTKTNDDKVVPTAVLGIREKENLFITSDNQWDGKYLPAFVRRYPFVLSQTADESELSVCIDESYAGFSSDVGKPLFDENGNNTPLLQETIDFLSEYQNHYQRTELFVRQLMAMDLLQSLDANIKIVDGRQFVLSGLLVVDEKKLMGLTDAKVLALFRTGELAWIYAHLISLGNFADLVTRIAEEK